MLLTVSHSRFGAMNLWAIQGKEIFALDNDRLLVSRDMGRSWSALGAGAHEVTCLCLDGRRLYAGSARYGVFVSTDRGNTWNLSDNGLMTAGILHLTSNGNSIFAGSKGFGLYRSTDGGEVWMRLMVNPEENYAPWDFTVALEASGNMVYARTWISFLQSSDGERIGAGCSCMGERRNGSVRRLRQTDPMCSPELPMDFCIQRTVV